MSPKPERVPGVEVSTESERPVIRRPRSHPQTVMEILGFIANGTIHSRPTVYKGVTFRSRLEVRYAYYLDSIGERWAYEPHTYGPRGRRYLPDFQLLDAIVPTFIEVKPRKAEASAAQRKAAVIWDTHPDAIVIVMCEEGCTYYAGRLGRPWVEWTERWA